jgi:hypothetical protein
MQTLAHDQKSEKMKSTEFQFECNSNFSWVDCRASHAARTDFDRFGQD